jgi:hypothetical protein
LRHWRTTRPSSPANGASRSRATTSDVSAQDEGPAAPPPSPLACDPECLVLESDGPRARQPRGKQDLQRQPGTRSRRYIELVRNGSCTGENPAKRAPRLPAVALCGKGDVVSLSGGSEARSVV